MTGTDWTSGDGRVRETLLIDTIDKALAEIAQRLQSKGQMYAPDDEWARLQKIAAALKDAKREFLVLSPPQPTA
jgi:hypothetical protein